MADQPRPEFDILDSEGLEYHRWVSDVETTFVAKDYSTTLLDPENCKDNAPSEKMKAAALMFLRRHIDPSLRWEYLQLKTPKELWDALQGRFGNIHDTLLPELTVQWNEIRLVDYKKVNDFNKDMLRLEARLNFCQKIITEGEMIEKTLSTFPTSALILANQYRLEYNNKRITTYNQLIVQLQVAERHNEVLLNNNARPIGTKKIPEAHYGKMSGGKNPNVKGEGRTNPYSHGQNSQRGRGRGNRGGRGGRGGRGMARGGSSKVWRRDVGAGSNSQGSKAPTKPPVKRERAGEEPCFRCGTPGHWSKHCQASNKVAAAYKKYRESKEQESHCVIEEENEVDANLTIADFSGKKNTAQSIDAPDFD
ncbi:unnamed protein product [Cuscuta epithymum]|uniref:CCHC-type domain-containing protein n=1 Tax=Cuscuta epithymum TaxID=186058 RepID=A0AAV0DCJ2_9ASTE|nr:unnamed protein product [Cuscuta epithymum]